MIKRKLNSNFDFEEIKSALDREINTNNLFVGIEKDFSSSKIFQIVGHVKKYHVDNNNVEFEIKPLMNDYEDLISDSDSVAIEIEKKEDEDVPRLVLLKNNKYL